jgi:hypothetical protein
MNSSSDLLALLALSPDSSEEMVLQLLIEVGGQVVGAEEGSLLVYDPERKDLAFAMTVGGADQLVGQRVPLNKGLTGLAAATREVQIGAPTFSGVKQLSSGPEAVIAAPMLVGDELVGVITAVSFTPGKRFSSKDGELYGRLASVAGLVVAHRRKLHNIATGSAEQGSEVQRSIADSLSRIAKAGPTALAHTARVLVEIEALVARGSVG